MSVFSQYLVPRRPACAAADSPRHPSSPGRRRPGLPSSPAALATRAVGVRRHDVEAAVTAQIPHGQPLGEPLARVVDDRAMRLGRSRPSRGSSARGAAEAAPGASDGGRAAAAGPCTPRFRTTIQETCATSSCRKAETDRLRARPRVAPGTRLSQQPEGRRRQRLGVPVGRASRCVRPVTAGEHSVRSLPP